MSQPAKHTSNLSRQVEFMRAIRGELENRLAPMKITLHYLDLIEEPSKIAIPGLAAYAIKGTAEHNETKCNKQFVIRFRACIGDTEREDVDAMVTDLVQQLETAFYPKVAEVVC